MIFELALEWKQGQMCFQNSETNSNQGDLEALIEPYDVKLLHLLKTQTSLYLGGMLRFRGLGWGIGG